MKLLKVLSLILIVGFVSCEKPLTEEDFMGECFPSSRLDRARICFVKYDVNGNEGNYYRAYFGTEAKDFYLNCGGEGTWRFENNTIILGPNNSRCGNIRNLAGRYPQK